MQYRHLVLLFLTFTLIAGCSGDNGDNTKNAAEKMTSEVAEQAVHHIRDPVDKAREAASTVEEHGRQIKKHAD